MKTRSVYRVKSLSLADFCCIVVCFEPVWGIAEPAIAICESTVENAFTFQNSVAGDESGVVDSWKGGIFDDLFHDGRF